MNAKKTFTATIVVIALFLSACGAPATPQPTPTSLPTPTLPPTPTQTSTPTPVVPKEGKWSGERISFTVLSPNQIVDFILTIDFGPAGTCEITFENIPIGEGSLTLTQDFDISSNDSIGAKFIKETIGEKGTLEVFSGQFTSPTEFVGTLSTAFFCGDQFSMGDAQTNERSAQWVEP